ncbi:30S ribosomal protein S17 [Bacteriovorax sp. Seq25_V]|uniref:30S ribosomal protein S17 n=1 Tax=Bacteriovorax sp. Seq25_V TaxID=1201288 RepID=UPI000389E641|nr:30S ribosomal protein S17 [Bacteriovorax sp. Seq25_V]EQC46792.1 30S ribosomal protein S17 [Bacteriovorax sp. Seq25_V]
MSTIDHKAFKRKLDGVVVSVKNEKTVVVNVARRFKHDVYSKFVTKTKKYHAHDESGLAKLGDTVTIIESKPYSKLKKWELFKVNN